MTGRAKIWTALIAGVLVGGTAAALWAYRHVSLVLRIGDEVPVHVHGTIPFRAAIEQRVDVGIDESISANVKLGRLEIPIDESIEVPIDMLIKVPIDTQMRVDQSITVDTRVPIDMVLTERELDLSQLEVPIDTDIFIDDVIPIDVMVPIDTEIETAFGVKVPVKGNFPVKLKVPLRQKVHVRDTLKLGVKRLRVPLKVTIPVHMQLPIKQSFAVTGEVEVPLKRRLSVPIKQIIRPDMSETIPAVVTLTSRVPAQLKANLDANVTVDQAIPTQLGKIRIQASELTLEQR